MIRTYSSQYHLNCYLCYRKHGRTNAVVSYWLLQWLVQSSALQWRQGLCDPTTLRAILAEASASGRFYQARQVKGQDPDKQLIESMAAGRGQCSQADAIQCILVESYCCSGENTATVGRCCVHQLSNQQPKEISEEIRPVSG